MIDHSQPEAIMLIFAILFAVLAVLGSLVGFGTIGHPIGSQSIDSYGWAVCVNGVVIAAFLLSVRYRRIKH